MNTQLPVRRFAGVFLLAAVVLVGCGEKAPPLAEAPPPAVTVSTPLARQVVQSDEYEGRINSLESVEVRDRVRGHLTKVTFVDGQMVEQGSPLFEIDRRQFELALKAAEATKAAADAGYQLASSELARTQRLVRSGGAASREEMEIWAAKRSVPKAE